MALVPGLKQGWRLEMEIGCVCSGMGTQRFGSGPIGRELFDKDAKMSWV